MIRILSVVGGVLGSFAGYLDTFFLTLLDSRELAPTRLVSTYVWISVLAGAAGVYASSRARESLRALIGGAFADSLDARARHLPGGRSNPRHGTGELLVSQPAGGERYVGAAVPTLALLVYAFWSFRPEPWLSERAGDRALRFAVVGGLLLTIGFW